MRFKVGENLPQVIAAVFRTGWPRAAPKAINLVRQGAQGQVFAFNYCLSCSL